MEIARQAAIRDRLETGLKEAADMGLAPRSDTDDAIDQYITDAAFSFYHPSGTYPPGIAAQPPRRPPAGRMRPRRYHLHAVRDLLAGHRRPPVRRWGWHPG
jgi:hypothetical protein